MADPTPHDLRGTAVPAGEIVPPDPEGAERMIDEWWQLGAADRRADSLLYGTPEAEVTSVVDEPYEPPPSFVAATERYAARMRDAGLEVTVTVHSPGHVTIRGRDPEAEEHG